VRSTRDRRERALLLVNKDRARPQSVAAAAVAPFLTGLTTFEDVSSEGHLEQSSVLTLSPSDLKVVWGRC
ncbi:MAG: hypothetical protein QOD06_1034, partial [Candidatus Binatota bacterium]|nr:hypothetical protein [Candidatus Binatota bacterium]